MSCMSHQVGPILFSLSIENWIMWVPHGFLTFGLWCTTCIHPYPLSHFFVLSFVSLYKLRTDSPFSYACKDCPLCMLLLLLLLYKSLCVSLFFCSLKRNISSFSYTPLHSFFFWALNCERIGYIFEVKMTQYNMMGLVRTDKQFVWVWEAYMKCSWVYKQVLQRVKLFYRKS